MTHPADTPAALIITDRVNELRSNNAALLAALGRTEDYLDLVIAERDALRAEIAGLQAKADDILKLLDRLGDEIEAVSEGLTFGHVRDMLQVIRDLLRAAFGVALR